RSSTSLEIQMMGLPKEVVDAPSLEVIKARLGSLVYWLVTLNMAGGLKPDDHCGPFQPRPFCDSMMCCSTQVKYTFKMKALITTLRTEHKLPRPPLFTMPFLTTPVYLRTLSA
uniref:Uncharacterized protein n=1 Tax=Meleagris gallopavo TaxID=9103 RepID=A0A803Y5X4_MELGA